MPQTLPPPPALEHMLLENPAWPVVCLIAVAAALWTLAHRQDKAALGWAAIGAAAAGAGVFALAHFVDTERERMAARTQALVDAVVARDVETVRGMMTEDAALSVQGLRVAQHDLPARADRAMQQYPVTHHRIHDLKASADSADRGRTQMSLRTLILNKPVRTGWIFAWRRGDDGAWRLTEARWLTLNDKPASRSLVP